MFTSFIAGSLASWFFGVFFHLATAAPTSTDYDLQRRQSSAPSYVLEYGEKAATQCGRQHCRLLAPTNVGRIRQSILPSTLRDRLPII
jgi:hypothetical protein